MQRGESAGAPLAASGALPDGESNGAAISSDKDFHSRPYFWPGKGARLPALGAEETALAWRALCLRTAAAAGMALSGEETALSAKRDAAPEEILETATAHGERDKDGSSPKTAISIIRGAKGRNESNPATVISAAHGAKDRGESGPDIGLDIFGDDGWLGLLPDHARLRPPVDYYARLPGIYAKARFSLCLTSMQLPHGLTQRHFDVWTAGGLLLTDATPGLSLFPEDLTRVVRFTAPGDIEAAAQRAEDYPGGRAKLIADWQNVILEQHTYAHRAAAVLEALSS